MQRLSWGFVLKGVLSFQIINFDDFFQLCAEYFGRVKLCQRVYDCISILAADFYIALQERK